MEKLGIEYSGMCVGFVVVDLPVDAQRSVSRFKLTMNDFSVHRIIGRGGFGEVYGCRKADTGKM